MTVEVSKSNNYLVELKNTQELCSLLMKTPHYAKMGQEGIFAVVETAKSLNIDPRLALGGGLYYVKGKVEMSARMMAALIRQKKHSITRDARSNDKICILHGKRSDTKDCWTESFSIDEARKANLTKNPVWQNFTRDMLYARALSRLARQLFPDIIGNCYVEGEISLDSNIQPIQSMEAVEETPQLTSLREDQVAQLEDALDKVPDYKTIIVDFLNKKGITHFHDIPKEMFAKILAKAQLEYDHLQQERMEA